MTIEIFLTYGAMLLPIIGALTAMFTAAGKLLKAFRGLKNDNDESNAKVLEELKAVKQAYNALEREVHKANVAMTHVDDKNIRSEEYVNND